MEIFVREKSGDGLSREEIREALLKSLEGRSLKNVLILQFHYLVIKMQVVLY